MAENNNALSHQEIGRNLKLFFFDDVSPGSCFFLRGGQYVYNRLIEMIRYLYNNNDYNEVSTPIICNSLLWKTSGHYEKYVLFRKGWRRGVIIVSDELHFRGCIDKFRKW